MVTVQRCHTFIPKITKLVKSNDEQSGGQRSVVGRGSTKSISGRLASVSYRMPNNVLSELFVPGARRLIPDGRAVTIDSQRRKEFDKSWSAA